MAKKKGRGLSPSENRNRSGRCGRTYGPPHHRCLGLLSSYGTAQYGQGSVEALRALLSRPSCQRRMIPQAFLRFSMSGLFSIGLTT